LSKVHEYIKAKLAERQQAGNYRQLKPDNNLIDFCSNDYLGFARSEELKNSIYVEMAAYTESGNGSTGSRLLAGNSNYAEELEKEITAWHGYEAGLLYNSGYDANLGLLSSIPQRGDTIITDELVHASIIDGARLSHAHRYSFKHNDTDSLLNKLQHAKGLVYIVVESIYSMDGDAAPLAEIAAIAQQHGAYLIVDEAHATGVFGKGLVDQLGLQRQVFAQVVTFGKAMGCHGAIVLGSDMLRNYLINYSRSFIYTTAAPFHQLAAIKMAYQLLRDGGGVEQEQLHQYIALFKQGYNNANYQLIPSNSAIQCLILKSNHQAKVLAAQMQVNGFDVRPILSPTVAEGTERIRICLHAFNTADEITAVLQLINNLWDE
jgi:8-amino-7-oxononanoate synthase